MGKAKFIPLTMDAFRALPEADKQLYRERFAAHETAKARLAFWGAGAALAAGLVYWHDTPDLFESIITMVPLWVVWAFNRL